MNTEKIAKYTLWALAGISVIVCILFFINFSRPWEEDPKMYDPQFLDVLLVWAIALLVIATVAALSSFIMYVKEWGFNKSYIYLWGLPIVTCAIGAAIGFAEVAKGNHMLINGEDWFNPTELIITDTCITSIGIMFIGAIAAVCYSLFVSLKK